MFVLVSSTSNSFADPLVFEDMGGNQYDANAIVAEGKPVVFVFWQTWCASCKREAPELADAVWRYGKSMQFFGVISGPDEVVDDEKVRRVADEWNHPQPQVRDRDLTLTKHFKVRGTPVIIVLGKGGRELFRGYRLPEDWEAFLAPKPT